jgi:type II secretory pathway pseudopilin PulG
MGTNRFELVYTIGMKTAFTLIELIVAASIAVLLVSIAIPKYSKYSIQQEFNSSVGSLTYCLQKGQQSAAAPAQDQSSQVAYSVITLANGTGGVTCTLDLYGANIAYDPTTKLPVPASRIAPSVIVASVSAALCNVRSSAITSGAINPPDSVIVEFDANNRGIPNKVVETSGVSVIGNPVAGYGSGANLTMDFNPFSTDVTTSCAASGAPKATILMSRPGLPIQLCTTYGTSCI